MKGTVEYDGRTIEWEWNGMFVRFGVLDSVRLPGSPSAEEISAAVIGWHQGYVRGKHAGRSILQNEFRNLMDCQTR